MAIRAVIFDLGGVIVRTEDQAPRRQLAERFGLSSIELESLVFQGELNFAAQLGQVSAARQWESVCQALKWPLAEVASLRQAFFAGDRLDGDLVAFIRGLRPRCRTALLSNAFDDLRALLEGPWALADAFDEIVISAEVGLMKPDPRIYRLALARLGVEPAEAVFIDDSLPNVEAASALGLAAIWFRHSAQAQGEVEALVRG
jgi:epoxide hydrolase-like predicted phosphatase